MELSEKVFFIVIVAALCLPAFAQSNTDSSKVFQIGVFDRSSTEFAQGTPKQPVTFKIGSSTKNWYASQAVAPVAGSAAPKAEIASAPRTIQFVIPNAPAASYRLHVALLIESRSVPALRVGINGKWGTFYLQSTLDSRLGDMDESSETLYVPADFLFEFPGSYLHRGTNTITFHAIAQESPVAPYASLTYDAIELDREVAPLPTKITSAQILPTIFYQQRQGQLDEIVNVFICYREPVKPGSGVDFTLAGNHYHQALRGNQDFGEEKLEFAVPEFPAQTHARLAWTIAGQLWHKEQSLDPQKKWTLFVVPHIHLDVGYSDYQAKVANIQSRVIDEALDLIAQHPSFRFSLDGEWPLAQFMKTRTPADQQRVIAAMRKRQLFVPAQYANLLTGFSTTETLIRSLYADANFSREHGTPFNYANITDVPSYSWSYASILASAGIKYFIAGPNGRETRAPVLIQGRLNEKSPFWWQGPDGKKVLFWYARHYWEMGILFGVPPVPSAGRATLPLFLQTYERPSYHANAVIIYGSQPENTDLFPQQAELAQQWNSVYAYPRLRYSGFYDALKNVAQQFGSDIPTVRGDGGPYWEDGIASDARYAAMERQNESRGPAAEELATLTSLVNPRLAADKADLERMWTNMVLMDEHTFNSHDSVSDPTSEETKIQSAVKDQYAVNAHALADFVSRNSMASLANSISVGRNSLIVFNTLNWKRSGFVSIDLSIRQEIVDPSTGQVVPYEVLDDGSNFRHVQFMAQNVPAVGYKVFQLRHTEKPQAPAPITHTTILESPYYRVELDTATGAVRSIYDKKLQRELVNQQSPYRFGQYLYVAGGDPKPNSVLQYRLLPLKAKLQIDPARNGHLISVTRTPYGLVARMESTDTNTPAIASEIRLFDHQKKIEFIENVNKTYVKSREGVYFAFPFAMDHPQFQYEIQNGVIDPAKDMYPGAGHEWFSVQHWISVQQDGLSATVMPLDTALVTLGDINCGAWPAQFGQRQGTVFSYVMNNYWSTNYNAGQGGYFRFRYVITSAPSTNGAELSRMGWQEMTPLEKDEVTSQDKALNLPRSLNGKQGSFLNVNDPDLLLEAWKPAEDGNGTILRFLDLGGATRTVNVRSPLLNLKQAWQTDAVERNGRTLPLAGSRGFRFTVHPHEIVTVRIAEAHK
jgi:alpha-mannosidase